MAEIAGLEHPDVMDAAADEVGAFLAGLPGRLAHRPVVAREAVSTNAIHAWCHVMGETNPAYAGADPLAPPARCSSTFGMLLRDHHTIDEAPQCPLLRYG